MTHRVMQSVNMLISRERLAHWQVGFRGIRYSTLVTSRIWAHRSEWSFRITNILPGLLHVRVWRRPALWRWGLGKSFSGLATSTHHPYLTPNSTNFCSRSGVKRWYMNWIWKGWINSNDRIARWCNKMWSRTIWLHPSYLWSSIWNRCMHFSRQTLTISAT